MIILILIVIMFIINKKGVIEQMFITPFYFNLFFRILRNYRTSFFRLRCYFFLSTSKRFALPTIDFNKKRRQKCNKLKKQNLYCLPYFSSLRFSFLMIFYILFFCRNMLFFFNNFAHRHSPFGLLDVLL